MRRHDFDWSKARLPWNVIGAQWQRECAKLFRGPPPPPPRRRADVERDYADRLRAAEAATGDGNA